MRKKEGLKFLLMSIGRNLRDIDIIGIGERGKYVCAQVTQESDVNRITAKMKTLTAFGSKSATLFFFGPKVKLKRCPSITYVLIDDVFKYLKKHDTKILIEKMLPSKYFEW